MKSSSPQVRNQSRPFAVDEMFFSTTDPRGIITSGNDVFVRISGYTEDELIGQAHNIIRHPDMPQAAFRLVWSHLKAGQTVAALVKNLAHDGCFYWVVALITPTPQGFLSVRFKPTGTFLATVEPLYAAMLSAEKAARAGGTDLAGTMDAGERVLQEGLRAHGFENYGMFMRELLCAELQCRDASLQQENKTVVRRLGEGAAGAGESAAVVTHLGKIYGNGCRAYGHLQQLYQRLGDFVVLNQTLDQKSSFINGLTGELQLASMNIALMSSRLGSEGQSLSVISRHMGATSGDVAGAVRGLVVGMGALSERLRAVIFNLAAGRLQIEMLLIFVHELITRSAGQPERKERRALIHTLHEAFSATMTGASAALHDLEGKAHSLNSMSGELQRHMLSLQVSQLGGVVESVRLIGSRGIGDIFTQIRRQIDHTRGELSELRDALARLDALANETPGIAHAIESAADQMESDIGHLAQV